MMPSPSTTPEVQVDESVPLKAEMDNKGFQNSNANSEADVQGRNNEISEQRRPGEQNLTNNEGEEAREELKYGARHIIMIFVPVSLCMIVVVFTITCIPFYSAKGIPLPYTPFEHEEDIAIGSKLWQSLANTLIVLVMVVVMTFLLFFLYKYRCYKFIHGYLFVASLIILFIFFSMFCKQLINYLDITMDYISGIFIMWNLCVVGMISVHWKGPLMLQQSYLLMVSALLAVTFIKHLPDWTTWGLLVGVSLWDLVAVLSPIGPLRSIVNLAQERNEAIFPVLIYSTTMVWKEAGGDKGREMEEMKAEDKDEKNNQQNEKRESEKESGGDSTRGGHKGETNGNTGIDVSPGSSGFTTKNEERIEMVSQAGDGTKAGEDDGKNNGVVVGDGLVVGNGGRIDGDGLMLGVDGGVRVDDELPILVPIPMESEVRVVNFNNSSEAPEKKHEKSKTVQITEEDESDASEDDTGVKLGLGDFIFYSILVGKASMIGDWNTTIACFIAVLVGLCSTLLLLSTFKKALPALPISIGFGLIYYFATSQLVRPFLTELAAAQVYI